MADLWSEDRRRKRAAAEPLASRMRVEPDWVSVDFLLVERSATHELKNVSVQLLCAAGEDRKIIIKPERVNVVLKGRPEKLEKFLNKDQ